MTNRERANHGSMSNQDTRIGHQLRQVERRDARKAKKAKRESQGTK
jgi:hypothetical protein